MIFLLIKGDASAAIRATAQHHMPVMLLGETPCGETMAYTDDDQMAAVVAWYVVGASCLPGAGYPPRTLLWYVQRDGAAPLDSV